MQRPRFEVRSCKSGYLQEVHGTIEAAIECAVHYFKEGMGSQFITDTDLPAFGLYGTPDVRTVYGSANVTPQASAWVIQCNRNALRADRMSVQP